MLLLLARLIGGAIDQRPDALSYLLDPGVLLGTAFGTVGLILLWRRDQPLLLLAVLTYLVLLPLVNTKFRTLVTARYLMPVYPLIVVGIALAVDRLARRLEAQSAALRSLILGLAIIALIVPSLESLQRHYDRLLRTGDTNERILKLADVIAQYRRPDEQVVVEESMGSEIPGTGVTEIRGFRYLLTMADVPFRSERIAPRRFEDDLQTVPSMLAVLNARDAEQVERRVTVTAVDGRARAVIGRGSDYQVYRLER
jgi:hypothetical protein